MSWLAAHWLDALGWGGSALLIWSVLQTRLLRFRMLNLAASVVLTVFNAVLGIWPMVAMNFVLVLINAWHLRTLLRQREDETAFEVLEVDPDDTYLRHVLVTHRADILTFQPDLDVDAETGRLAFLVQLGDETVGVVLLRPQGETAHIELDWVNPRFRDFAPGRFVWRRSQVLREHGFTRVETSPAMVAPYYAGIGFHPEQGPEGPYFSLDLAG